MVNHKFLEKLQKVELQQEKIYLYNGIKEFCGLHLSWMPMENLLNFWLTNGGFVTLYLIEAIVGRGRHGSRVLGLRQRVLAV